MEQFRNEFPYPQQGLYHPEFEHDNCGIGAIVNIKGERSRRVVEDALSIVEKLEHRAGKDAEGKTGDGVGILVQMPYGFMRSEAEKLGFTLGEDGDFAVGMFFFPQNERKRSQAKKLFEIIVKKGGLEFLGWRTVPSVPDVLGQKARDSMPYIMQGFVKRPEDCEKGLAFSEKLC